MTVLLASAAICCLLVLATILRLAQMVTQRKDGELLRLSETIYTAAFAVLLIAMAGFILWMKYSHTEIAGKDPTSYFSVGVFAVMCAAVGCGVLFYTFLRKVIVYEEGVVFINLLGAKKQIQWNEITEIKISPLTNKIGLISGSSHFSVGGEAKAYKEFLRIAQQKVKPNVGGPILDKLRQ